MSPDEVRDHFSAHGFAGPFGPVDLTLLDRLRALYERRGHDFLWSKRNQHVVFPEMAEAGTNADILAKVSSILGPDLLLWTGHLLPRTRRDSVAFTFRWR